MNPLYKQSVLTFGVIIPVVIVTVLLVAAINIRGKLEAEFDQRELNFSQYKRVQVERKVLEDKVRDQEPHMNRWMSLFTKATSTDVNSLLGEIQKQFKGTELQQTAFRQGTSSGGIGGASAQPSVQIQLGFRGTYRALQTAFLELETRMPHLQLDSLKFTVHPNRQVLNAEINYTAWQKE